MNRIKPLALFGSVIFSMALAGLAVAESSPAHVKPSEIPRERLSLDVGWRFRLGDPLDVTTDVSSYPEVGDLSKLPETQVSGSNSETSLESTRVDILAKHAGEKTSFVRPDFNDSDWRGVDLPHDWAVELPFDARADYNHGFKAIGDAKFGANNIGWYRRTFTLPKEDAGRELLLEFDGVYRNCLVWLNGHILGRNVSGYSSFSFDATPYAIPGGTNVLVVRVDATRFEGWFYEGAGIYRHVWLTKTNPIHVPQWGTFIHTLALSGSNATVAIETEITNQGETATANGALTSTIFDASGRKVASVTSPIDVPAGKIVVAKQSVSFPANLWSLQTPYLYKLVTTIKDQNAVMDLYNTPFGVRTVSIDPNKGVFINGEPVEIHGLCNHQDHAGVGVALPDRLQYFRIERLLQMGANAYRTSHNAPTPEMLDACDKLGILVLDENRRIGKDTETMSQLTRQIRRDRNHPSIFMWSLGNEEPLQGSQTGAEIVRTMQDAVHSMDPSRRCTLAMNGKWGTGFSTVIDVQGFNYFMPNMDKFHSSFPNQPCIGTEIASHVGDRGIYLNDKEKCYVSAYDLKDKDVGWEELVQEWVPFFHARPWISGGFAWTGFDYRGEPTPYNKTFKSINSHFGTLDTCGFPKDNAFFYQANWSLKPVLHLFPHWNWEKPGQPINVWAFGNCKEVELFLNGSSLGRKPLTAQSHVEWSVPYAPGTLKAIGYRLGNPATTSTIETVGAPARIALSPDRGTILADGRDISVITVSVLDAKGRLVPTASNEISFSIKGGTIIGVGNGDPSSHEADKASKRSLFNGLAQVIVQSASKPGAISLVATSSGLNSADLSLTAANTLPTPAAPTGVSAAAGYSQAAVSWDIVAGAIAYNVFRSTAHGGPYELIAANVSGVNLGYVDHSAANGTKYYYVVSANGNATGPKSAEVSATPTEEQIERALGHQ